MPKPEGETTRLLRSTMDFDLDAVNAKLVASGEPAIDALTLRKKRSWIKGKDRKRKEAKSMARGPAKTLRQKPSAKGKKNVRRLVTEPREGTFAAFVWGQPYDLDVNELLKRAKEAKIGGGNKSQIYKVRQRYPQPKEKGPAMKLNPIATSAALREQDAKTRQRRTVLPVVSSNGALGAEPAVSDRAQFVLFVMSIGTRAAKQYMSEVEAAVDRLGVINEGGL